MASEEVTPLDEVTYAFAAVQQKRANLVAYIAVLEKRSHDANEELERANLALQAIDAMKVKPQ